MCGGTTPQQPTAGGGSGGGSTTDPCGNTAQIQFVKEVSESYYYWYDELAQVNENDYDDAPDYLAAISAAHLDRRAGRIRFSYLTTIEEDEARFTSGAFYGYGVRYRIINNNFSLPIPCEEGPAHTAGIRRGQRLLAVKRDGETDFETGTKWSPVMLSCPGLFLARVESYKRRSSVSNMRA